MAKFEEHCDDCERLLGKRCEEVNRWMDAEFRRYGPQHRFVRHHAGGIEEARILFGGLGEQAAMLHVLKDCGHIPTVQDWAERRVNELGMANHEGMPGWHFDGTWGKREFDRAANALLNGDQPVLDGPHSYHADYSKILLDNSDRLG